MPSESLKNLCSLAHVFGITAELVDVDHYRSLACAVENATARCGRVLVLDVASVSVGCTADEVNEVADLLVKEEVVVLLLTTRIGEHTDLFLQLMTKSIVRHAEIVDSAVRVSFPKGARGLSEELCAQSYRRKDTEALTLCVAADVKIDRVMELDERPSFVRLPSGNASFFVWSAMRLLDVYRPLRAEIEFEETVDEYVPAIIFLRFAFGDRIWHNPQPGAGILIDDPLLKKTYGFIQFPELLGSARKHGYRITLAFIPWNHWRSRPSKVNWFRDKLDCFAICAHGCDHTNNEFRSADYDELLQKNFVARQRMDCHARRTGLDSEPFMVCPQEQYSLAALRAFSDSRQFVALMCTACVPRNLSTPQIRAADLLLPAQDSFYGFPIFKRHYWNGMAVFAMALFLGKPAILVEHHEFFRNGSAGAEEFARRLVELRPNLTWRSLAETVTRTHVRRRVSKSKQEVRFFTDTFYLEHDLEQPMQFRFLRRIPETTQIKHVRADGSEVAFSREDGFLTFEIQLQRPKTLTVQVDVAPIKPVKFYSPGLRYQASVALRRCLSEFRDNVIARNRTALRTGRRLMKVLKQTAS